MSTLSTLEIGRRFKARLAAGEAVLGSWIQTGDPTCAEILANAGYDWIGIDCEHTGIDIEWVATLARAIHGRGAAILVRVPAADPLWVRKSLDVGANGVIVPMVETVEQARTVVSASLYPPVGTRGYCFGRMNDWGTEFADYAAQANDAVTIIAMIETARGVDSLDAILSVPQLDGVFIGPYDLSGSYGVPGQLEHPRVVDAKARVLATCRRLGKAAGLHLVRASDSAIRDTLMDGYTFVCIDGDIIFLNQAARDRLQVATRNRAEIQVKETP